MKRNKIILAVERAERYIERFPKWSDEQKRLNQRAYNDARNLSAWLSVFRFGNEEYAEQAGKIIYSIFGKKNN
jgi:hypothetical protein